MGAEIVRSGAISESGRIHDRVASIRRENNGIDLADYDRQLPHRFAVLPHELVFTTAFDVNFRGASYLDVDLDPNTRQSAYTLVNGRIGISNAEETLSLTVSVDNIMDTDALEYATDSILYPGGYVVMQEFQRNFAVQLRYAF